MAEFVARFDKVIPHDLYTLPIAEQRRLYRSLPTAFPYRRPDDVVVRDLLLTWRGSTIPTRVYAPTRSDKPGVLCYTRGDGFCLGSLDTHDTVAAELASKTGYVTVFVDVRLAPEHKFPAAVHDLRAVVECVSAEPGRLGARSGPIGLIGDSSGGNLVVANCILARDEGGPAISCQGLVSPVLDFARWQTGGEDVPILTAGEMEFYAANYVQDPDELLHPLVSPLRSASVHNLPPATVLATELDSLKTDAIEYAAMLTAAGVDVDLTVAAGLVHAPLRARAWCPAAARAWTGFCGSLTARMDRVLGEPGSEGP